MSLRRACRAAQKPVHLLAEVEQNRTRLEDREAGAARAIWIDDGWNFVVRVQLQVLRVELLPFPDIDGSDLVREPDFFEHEGNLMAIGRWKKVELDRLLPSILHASSSSQVITCDT
jgi:hypothetical protein